MRKSAPLCLLLACLVMAFVFPAFTLQVLADEGELAASTQADSPAQEAGSGQTVDIAEDADTAQDEGDASDENAQVETEEGEAEDEWDGWGDGDDWGEAGLSYFGTFSYWHSLDRTSGLDKHEGELALTFSFKDYSGRLRVGNYNPFADRRRDLRIEKCELNAPLGELEFTAGTFAQTLGKGMVLSGIEYRDLGVDNEIEGLRLSWPGEHFSALAFIGQHKLPTDRGATRIWGARAEVSPASWIKAGGNAFTYKPTESVAFGNPAPRQRYEAVSVDAELSWDVLSAYFEYMRLDWPQDDDGRGIYGNLTLSLPGFGATYEYKDYWRVHGRFAAPPPVRYDPEHAEANLVDEKGYGLTMTWLPFSDGTLIEASYAQSNIRNKGWPGTEFIATYHSPPGERFSWTVQRLYHRDVLLRERAYYGELNYDWGNGFTTQLAVELRGVDEGTGVRDEQEVSLDIGYSDWLTLVLSQERAERGNSPAALRWNLVELKLQQSGIQELALAYGKRREGFVCSGGVCRTEPEFDGWRLEYRRFF